MMTQSHSAPITVSKDLRDVDEHADQGPAADERADDHDQRRPAHPAGLHQLRHVDRLGPGRVLPDFLQQPALASQAPAERRVERRPVQMPERACQHLGIQAPGRGVRRLVPRRPPPPSRPWRRPGHDRADRATRSPMALRKSVTTIGLRGRVDQQRVPADRAVGDPGPAQGQQLTVEVIKRGVADVGGVGLGQRRRRPAAGRRAARPWTVPRSPPRRARARPRPPGRPAG